MNYDTDQVFIALLANMHCTLKLINAKKGKSINDAAIQKQVLNIFESYFDSSEVLSRCTKG